MARKEALSIEKYSEAPGRARNTIQEAYTN